MGLNHPDPDKMLEINFEYYFQADSSYFNLILHTCATPLMGNNISALAKVPLALAKYTFKMLLFNAAGEFTGPVIFTR